MVSTHFIVTSMALLPLVFGKEMPPNEEISRVKYASGLVHETIMSMKMVGFRAPVLVGSIN